MGNSEIKHRFWVAITANDPETVRAICTNHPHFINEPISDDQKTSAVTRAAYLDRPHILAVLASMGADLNKPAGSGITALMWAAARGNEECVKFLLNFGADPTIKGPYNLTATDFSILYGYYNTAYILHFHGYSPTKSAEEFLEIKGKMQTLYVDFPCMLMSLEKMIPPDIVPFFTLPPIKREIELSDPVRDPNETWGNWIHRVMEFEKPPLIERNSLPEALQPQNTITGKMKILLKLENAPVPVIEENKEIPGIKEGQEYTFDAHDARKVRHMDENAEQEKRV